MGSIFTKILAWVAVTIGVAVVGLQVTSRLISPGPGRPHDMIAKTQALQLDEARRAYEDGGPEGLAAFLRRLDLLFEAEHSVVDRDGRDLADGRDRSALLARSSGPGKPPPLSGAGAGVITSQPDADGRRLLIVVRPPHGPPSTLPYFLWTLLVIVGLGYALAVHLARPLLKLRRAVERFGRGELSTRIGWSRKDEIGALSRAFDEMAGRIETLLDAERRLLQDVSHELRSPLARLGFAVALARTSDDRGAALDRIQKDVGRLSALVDELLQLTRAEGDPSSRTLADVRLDDLLRALADDAGLEAGAKGCRVALRADDPLTVRGESELLRRALENVVRNAVRYAPEGTTVDVDLSRRNGSATVTVRDYGAGVPDAALGSIFDPFFRVGDDRSRASGGVGLGLAIARRALELHGGSIAAANAGPGLLVTVELPRAVPAPNRAAG